jgi:hypothetical protein
MDMKMMDAFRAARSAFRASLQGRYADEARKPKGEVFLTLRDGPTGVIQAQHRLNIVTLDASILIARLVKDNAEPPKGAYVLGVGTGDSGWNLQNPPAATNTQRRLFSEVTRKTFSNTQFIDSGGSPTAIPTNVVDFTTTFTESEAVGPLVEMGLIGGNIDSNLAVKNPVPSGPYDPLVDLTAYETLINYLTFPVVNKPATSTLEIIWRLTF